MTDPADQSDKASLGKEKSREHLRGLGGRKGEGKGHDGTTELLRRETEEAKGSLTPICSGALGSGCQPRVAALTVLSQHNLSLTRVLTYFSFGQSAWPW